MAITDTHQVLAYVGVGRRSLPIGREGLSRVTRSIRHGKIIIKNNLENPAAPRIHSQLVVPLWEKGEVTGALKIYYCHARQITNTLKVMAVGLSQIISTRSRFPASSICARWRTKPKCARCRQDQPHFLFNALERHSLPLSA